MNKYVEKRIFCKQSGLGLKVIVLFLFLLLSGYSNTASAFQSPVRAKDNFTDYNASIYDSAVPKMSVNYFL